MIGGNDMARRPTPRSNTDAGPPLFSSLDTQVIYCGDNLDKLREMPDRLRGPGLHRPAVQLEPELRGLLGRDEGEAGVRGPARIDQGVHRVHAAPMRRTGPRLEEDRKFLLPLRLAREPLRQGDARPDFRREQLPERDHLEADTSAKDWLRAVTADNHDTIFFYTKSGRFTWNRPFDEYDLAELDENDGGKYCH